MKPRRGQGPDPSEALREPFLDPSSFWHCQHSSACLALQCLRIAISSVCLFSLVNVLLQWQVTFVIGCRASLGLPRCLSGKESACRRRCEFDPWVRKIPWRRKWQPTPVFLLRKSHGQRILECYSPWGGKKLDTTELLSKHTRGAYPDRWFRGICSSKPLITSAKTPFPNKFTFAGSEGHHST